MIKGIDIPIVPRKEKVKVMKEWKVSFRTSSGEVIDEVIIKVRTMKVAKMVYETLSSYPMVEIEEVEK